MSDTSYRFEVKAEGQDDAGRSTELLADRLGEIDKVREVRRTKADDQTMDLGTILTVIVSSGATLAIARGIAAWLRARRGVTVTIWRTTKDESLKVAVTGVDPEAGLRVVEHVMDEKQ
jgi:hypothetical protein